MRSTKTRPKGGKDNIDIHARRAQRVRTRHKTGLAWRERSMSLLFADVRGCDY